MRELRVSYRRSRRVPAACESKRLSRPKDAAEIVRRLIGLEAVEVAVVLCLSVRHEVLSFHELSRGTLDATLVHPREVLKVALLANAAAVVVGHNHPSGDPTPSAEDVALTQRLRASGQLIGIEMIDHVIVSATSYVSLKESGLL